MTCPTITGAKAYIDTITLHSRQPLPKQVFRDVRRLQGKPLIPKRIPIITREGLHIGEHYFNSIHQPKNDTLRLLAPMQAAGTCSLHAVHVAFDFLVCNQLDALEAGQYFHERLTQRWRRPQEDGRQDNSYYFKRDRKSARNIIVYCDRPSKTGAGACCHLELRFTGAHACRRADLSDLQRLSRGIDGWALLRHETKIAAVDPRRFEHALERIVRQYFPKTRSRHRTVLAHGGRGPLTIAVLKARMRQLLARSLGVAPINASAVLSIRSQDIWDSVHPQLRSTLVEVPWERITPSPQWHAWR